ncbi:MAG TPA: PQQ-binding-like beta-propeller repeat protein [Pirellulales bacterium]|jgi:hypothetical protein|nr:PQQ-binding-like beta-propeller repeat protein [Pirellulales bacterium]
MITNDQLLQRVQDNLPEDLSLEEIELLRERVGQSPELRDALAGHLYWEQFLATGLSRGTLSAEQVVSRMRSQRMAARARVWRLFGWPLLLLAVAAGLFFSVRAWNREQPEPAVDLAQLPAAPADLAAATAAKTASDKPATASSPDHPPAAAGQAPAVDPLDQFSTDKPRPFAETCFQPLPPLETEADLARLKALWHPVSGSMTLGRKQDTTGASLTGKFELRTPWPPGQVLRLSPIDLDRLEFEISSQRELVSLQFVGRPSPIWAAYCSQRAAPGEKPSPELLAATDGDRYRRTAGGPIELRYQDGLVVLSRGDVLLLAAPLAGKPDRIVLDVPSRAMLGNMAFAPGEPFPLAAEHKAPAVAEKPAVNGPPQLPAPKLVGELPAGLRQSVNPDGSCELAANENLKPGWVAFDVSEPGTRELVFRIEAASPGTGIVLLDDDDRPRDGVGFMTIRRTQQLAIGYARPTDRVTELRDNGKGSAPLVSTPLWLRVVAGPSLKCWTSADGRNWAAALPGRPSDGRVRRIGIYCAAGKGERSIRVGPVRMRSLPALEVAEKHGRAFESATDSGAWLAAALAAQPADSKRSTWLSACAARTLAAGCRRDVARALIQALLRQVPEMPGTFSDRCDLIDELALLCDADSATTRQVVEAYAALGRTRDDNAKLWQPYSRIRRRLAESPPLVPMNTASLVEPLIRAEILELVYDDAWDELDKLCKQLDFFDASEPRRRKADRSQPAQLVDWAQALVRRNRPTKDEPAGTIPSSWRHPLIEQLGKEGFNILAELDAALAGGSYKDACQLISSVTPREATGLLPNSSDPALLVSLPGAVALAMRDHPPLLATMQAEFAPLGQLRLRQATAADDVAGVEAVTIQFYGTTAARHAHVWLGDRALTAGDFSEAEAHYRRATDEAAGDADPAIAARLRLAGAMQGRVVGSPVEDAVQLGDEKITAREFEKMIDEMLARATADRSRDDAQASSWRPLPPGGVEPAAYRLRRVAHLATSQTKQPAVAEGVPWDAVACETSLTLTAKAAIVSNPAEIAAYDRKTGQSLWKISGGPPPQRGHLWPPVAMRPAALDSVVLSRRWQSDNAQLVAIENGKIIWQTPPSVRVASDPLVLDDRVLAVTSAVLPQDMLELSLAAYDPHSGQQLALRPLAQFRDLWQHEMPCDLALAGDTVVVVAGGCTLGCTRDGEARWLRRETWVGGVVDQRSWPRRYGPPLVAGPLTCVAQPGVPAVSAVETSNGRLAWQRPMADLIRLVTVLPGKLLIQTARGYEALSLKDGSTAWQHAAPDALDGWLAGDASGFMYAARETSGKRESRARLIWLDAKTGTRRASALLADWQPEQAMLGPMAADGDRIWAVAGSSPRDAARELFEFIPSGPAPETPDDTWFDSP